MKTFLRVIAGVTVSVFILEVAAWVLAAYWAYTNWN